jgi:hypothetical protein
MAALSLAPTTPHSAVAAEQHAQIFVASRSGGQRVPYWMLTENAGYHPCPAQSDGSRAALSAWRAWCQPISPRSPADAGRPPGE